MNNLKSDDSPSGATMFGRGFCTFLPIPLFWFVWPFVIGFASDLLRHAGSTVKSGGDLDGPMTLTWDMAVGLFIGIQLSANTARCLLLQRRYRDIRDIWRTALTFFLTLLSALCLLGTVFCNGYIVIAFANDDFTHKILDLFVIVIIFVPVVIWFLVNFLHLVKKDHLLGPFLAS